MAKDNKNKKEAEVIEKETNDVSKENISENNEATNKTTEEIEKLTNEKNEINDKYLRLMAEYDNFRKRSQKEKDAIYPEAVADTVTKFLPLWDSFDRALSFECKDDEFKKGIEMINNSLNDIFKSLKVEEIGTVGETFDPNMHNAVMHEESDEYDESTVIEVFQKGFSLDGKVIRYAMVKVAN